MESLVVDEGSFKGFKGDTADDIETAAVKDEANEESDEKNTSSGSVGGHLVDSLKSTVESVTGLLPSLGLSAGQAEEEAEGSEVISDDVDEEAHASRSSPEGDQRSGDEEEEEVREESSSGGTTNSDDWSIVDMLPKSLARDQSGTLEEEEMQEAMHEAGDGSQFDSLSKGVEGEEEGKETGDRSGFDSESKSVEGAEEVQEGGEGPSRVSPSHSGYTADCPSVSASTLRRRPRTFSKGREDDASDVHSVDSHKSWHSEDSGISSTSEAKLENAAMSGSLGQTEVGVQVHDKDGNSVSNPSELTSTKERKFRFGFAPELEDDDASSISSRESGQPWKNSRSESEDGWEDIDPMPERSQRTEVDRNPGNDVEGEENGGEIEPIQILAEPAGLVVQIIEFQLKLIVHLLAVGIWLLNCTYSTVAHPINRTVEVKDKVTSAATGVASQVRGTFNFVEEGIQQVGPTMSKLSKKTFWGCLSTVYVIFMLGLLLIPALFVDVIVVNSMVHEPVVVKQPLDFDFTQRNPAAVLPLFTLRERERIKNLPPDKIVKTRVIPVGHKFHVTVSLTLPESDYNLNVGMFQLTAEQLTARDKVISRSSKPCRLKFLSYPIRMVKTLLYFVPHLFGFSREAQIIELRILEAQEKATPTAAIRILIEPKANGGGVPEIYEAAIALESTLSWPRALISRWKWLFFAWNGICLFVFEVSIVLCCCRGAIIPSFGRKPDPDEGIVQAEVMDERAAREATNENRSSRRGVRSNKRVYFEDNIPTATAILSSARAALLGEEAADDAEGMVEDDDSVS